MYNSRGASSTSAESMIGLDLIRSKLAFFCVTALISSREGFSATEIMRSSALAAALAAALCVLPAGHGHLGTAPGRFFAGVSGTTGDDAPPPPIPVNPGGGGNASCATAFSLNGSKYDVSALQVDVGGWVAENSVDKFSCAPNAPSLVCLHAAPSRASFGCQSRPVARVAENCCWFCRLHQCVRGRDVGAQLHLLPVRRYRVSGVTGRQGSCEGRDLRSL